MTPAEALQGIYNVARLAPVPASDHEAVLEAVKVLHELIESQPEPGDG